MRPSPTCRTRSSRWPPTSRRSSRCSAAARRRPSSRRARSRRCRPRRSPPPPEPAFKQRARLRDKRHGLVKTLAGFNGSSHREVNAWINRASGVRSVGDATIEQLERSIELLLAELDRLSRRRAS